MRREQINRQSFGTCVVAALIVLSSCLRYQTHSAADKYSPPSIHSSIHL